MKTESRITLHMVSSLDGFIARTDGSFDWLEASWTTYEKGKSEEHIEEFLATIDCYVLGSHTYELALNLGWPYGDTPAIVLTNRNLPSEKESVQFHSGDLKNLVNRIIKPQFKNIWLVGGAVLCREFINLSLVDEIRLSIVPILLGSGVPLFETGKENRLHLKDVTAYKNGMIEVWYEVDRNIESILVSL